MELTWAANRERRSHHLSSALVDKVEPYFGLKQNFAACAAIERPLLLISAEASVLTDGITDDMVSEASSRYDANKAQNALAFSALPRGIRTAIVSVWYQFGYPDVYPDYPKFWNFVTKNDWKGAVKELRKFYSKPSAQAPGNLRRRNNEADIIEATLAEV